MGDVPVAAQKILTWQVLLGFLNPVISRLSCEEDEPGIVISRLFAPVFRVQTRFVPYVLCQVNYS